MYIRLALYAGVNGRVGRGSPRLFGALIVRGQALNDRCPRLSWLAHIMFLGEPRYMQVMLPQARPPRQRSSSPLRLVYLTALQLLRNFNSSTIATLLYTERQTNPLQRWPKITPCSYVHWSLTHAFDSCWCFKFTLFLKTFIDSLIY